MRSVLIVDDQPGIRLLLEELFRRESYDVRIATNGLESLQEIKRKQPDCVLLDMKMSGLNGIDVLRKIKSDWPEVPVIMMTAYDEEELTEQALELGAVKYFTKPFDIFELREAVNNIMKT